MGSIIGGVALLALALFMLVGFLNADVDRGAGTTLLALLITVALPGVSGAALIARRATSGRRIGAHKEELRRRTLEAEVLRLAGRHAGRLTAVEVATELGVTHEEAESVLRDLARRDIADIEVTESGVLVYAFHDVRHLGEKPRAKGILDA